MLKDIKVIDLTQGIAGPYCTKLLADLGAEVIKIEKPYRGDITRRLGVSAQDMPEVTTGGSLFFYLNTNKKSITLNLKTGSGQKLFKQLVSGADVIIESFRPQTMSSFGLSYDALSAIKPSVVMTSVSSFGQSGLYRDYEATEIILYALSGLMNITGEPDREPLKLGTYMAQYVAGQNAFAATLAAFYRKLTTDKGQYIDVSIMECCSRLLEFQLSQYVFQNYIPHRIGYANEKGHPHGMFPCKDGWVALHVRTKAGWPAVIKLTGIKELDKPEYASDQGRIKHRDEITAYLLPWLAEFKGDDLVKVWEEAGLSASKVHTVKDLLGSPQLQARNFFIDIEHPNGSKVKSPSGPFKVNNAIPWRNGRAPLLGEHNKAVFGKLGYSEEDLTRLKGQGVI